MPKQANPSPARQKSAVPVVAGNRDSLPDEALVLLARQFASALVNELRTQFAAADTTAEQSKFSGTKKVQHAKDRAIERFHSFDLLPDDACVDVRVVAGLFGCSVATVWRRVAAGLLPEPERIVGTTRWPVAKLRSLRAGWSVDRGTDRAERQDECLKARPNALKRKPRPTEAEPTVRVDV